jgi:hypothetical protein
MRASLTGYLFAASLTGCAVLDFGSSENEARAPDHGEDEECKVEGAELGQVGATATLPGGETITFLDWVEKADSPGEYVGFLLSESADGLTYVVKHGGEVYIATGTAWMHPNGDEGPDAPAVSHIDFCECDDDGDGEPDDPGDDEPGDDQPYPD